MVLPATHQCLQSLKLRFSTKYKVCFDIWTPSKMSGVPLLVSQVECKKAQPKEVMLPANLAKARASTSTRGASYGEFILIPTMSATHAAPTSIRYTPYAIPIATASSAATHSSSHLSGSSRTHHILSTLEHGLSPYMTHNKNVFGLIANHHHHNIPNPQTTGITINHPIGLTMLPIQTVGIWDRAPPFYPHML